MSHASNGIASNEATAFAVVNDCVRAAYVRKSCLQEETRWFRFWEEENHTTRVRVGAVARGLMQLAQSAMARKRREGHVTDLSFAKDQGTMLFIRVDVAKTGAPGCDTNGSWTYVLSQASDTGKRLYALPLAAEIAGQSVMLSDLDACTDFGSIESLQSADSKR